MGVENSKEAKQIKTVEDRIIRQLKEMLEDRGFELKCLFDDTVCYRLIKKNGDEYEVKNFKETIAESTLEQLFPPWIIDLMMFHSHWYQHYYIDADNNFTVHCDSIMYDFLDAVFENSQL